MPNIGREHSLGLLLAGNAEVIDQIRQYAFKKDVAYGVISNGHQFIVARFVNTDGSDWKKNKALIFKSFDDIQKNFIEFHNLLSRENVIEKGGIFNEVELPTPQIILTSLAKRDDKLVRNEFSAAMIDVIDSAFKELSIDMKVNDRSILEHCYVKNKDIDKYNSELSVIFEDNPPRFDDRIAKLRNTDNTHEQLADALNRSEPIVLI